MGFNLFFAGFGCKEADSFCLDNDCLRLLSYYSDKPRIEKLVEQGKKFFLDSGAYTAHTKTINIDVDDYIKYINKRDDSLICFAQLDTIPGKFQVQKTQKDMQEAAEKSWFNYLYMRDKVKSPEKLMPIFHQGEDFKYLVQILNFEPAVKYMGISPANDLHTSAKEDWIEECFKIIKDSSNPDIKTHAFGMTSIPLLNQFPFYSADSTSWLMVGKSGCIMSKFGSLYISENLKFNRDHFNYLPEDVKEHIKETAKEFGFTLEDLSVNYKKRMLYNIKYLKKWSNEYVYNPKTVLQQFLFA